MAIGPLHIIAYSAGSALVAELLLWALIYRTPGFKTLNSNISKHTSLVDTAKEGGTGANAIKKKEARLQSLREETAKHVALVNFKTGVVVRERPLEEGQAGRCPEGAAVEVPLAAGSGNAPGCHQGFLVGPALTRGCCAVPAADHADAYPQHEPDGQALWGHRRGAAAL